MKKNTKQITKISLLVAFCLQMLLSGVSCKEEKLKIENNYRFEIIDTCVINESELLIRYSKILIDKKTGVKYLYINGYSTSIAITRLWEK